MDLAEEMEAEAEKRLLGGGMPGLPAPPGAGPGGSMGGGGNLGFFEEEQGPKKPPPIMRKILRKLPKEDVMLGYKNDECPVVAAPEHPFKIVVDYKDCYKKAWRMYKRFPGRLIAWSYIQILVGVASCGVLHMNSIMGLYLFLRSMECQKENKAHPFLLWAPFRPLRMDYAFQSFWLCLHNVLVYLVLPYPFGLLIAAAHYHSPLLVIEKKEPIWIAFKHSWDIVRWTGYWRHFLIVWLDNLMHYGAFIVMSRSVWFFFHWSWFYPEWATPFFFVFFVFVAYPMAVPLFWMVNYYAYFQCVHDVCKDTNGLLETEIEFERYYYHLELVRRQEAVRVDNRADL